MTFAALLSNALLSTSAIDNMGMIGIIPLSIKLNRGVHGSESGDKSETKVGQKWSDFWSRILLHFCFTFIFSKGHSQ